MVEVEGHHLSVHVSTGLWSGESDEGSENFPHLRGNQRHPEALRRPQWLPGEMMPRCCNLSLCLIRGDLIMSARRSTGVPKRGSIFCLLLLPMRFYTTL